MRFQTSDFVFSFKILELVVFFGLYAQLLHYLEDYYQ